MADLCFICNESLSQGDPVNVMRGLKASIERNDERSDSIGELVKDRILCEYDLIASEANFLNRLPSTEKKPRQDNQVSEAMAEIFNYMENHDNSQFTLKELRDVLTG
ncbi:hypothetical protein TNIN_57401, partial [Trichonephila inaurata madagascariensis]